MGCVVPTMPTPRRPQRARACCEYCRREIRDLADSCAGCGAPITADAHVDLIECTTLGDPTRTFIENGFCMGVLTRNEARALMRDETFRH